MAWVRCCGGKSKKGIIYKDGVFVVGMDNPGSYTAPGYTVVGATLSSDKFTIGPTNSGSILAVLGTTSKFDFTNYTRLFVRAKGLGAAASKVLVDLCSAKASFGYNRLISSLNIQSNTEMTYTIDVTSINDAYLVFNNDGISQCEVYEVWCE